MRGGIPTWYGSGTVKSFLGFRPVTRRPSTRPRSAGQLSGAVAKTKEGRAINRLKPNVLMITANNERGQRGSWPKRPRRVKRESVSSD